MDLEKILKIRGLIIQDGDYNFLFNKELHDDIMLLTLGGSYAYGTNVEGSDIDLRGIMFNPINSILGNEEFEQYNDSQTDTTIYGLNKICKLLLECNPNTIEMVGCEPSSYMILTKEGKELLDSKNYFLSKRAIASFGGYANAQLRRLENFLAKNSFSQEEKEMHILNSVHCALDDVMRKYHTISGKQIQYEVFDSSRKYDHAFNEYNKSMKDLEKWKNCKNGSIVVFPDESENPDMVAEIFCDISLKHFPLREYEKIMRSMGNVVKDYEKIGKRNHKKDVQHLNKHAMHLVRLFYMGIDILEKGEINTYRKNEHDLLMSIRNGDFCNDGKFNSSFFDLVDELEKKFDYAAKNTTLPDLPNKEAVQEMLIRMNRSHIERM